MSLSEPERGTGSASNLPFSAGRATSMPVARARRYVLAILRGRGRRPRPVGAWCRGPGSLGLGPYGDRGCLAGKKRGASESFIFRNDPYTRSNTRSHAPSIGVPRPLWTPKNVDTSTQPLTTVGGRGGADVRSYVSLPAPVVRTPSSPQSPLWSDPPTDVEIRARALPVHPGARAPEGLGRTADRTLAPITRAGRAPRPPLSSP